MLPIEHAHPSSLVTALAWIDSPFLAGVAVGAVLMTIILAGGAALWRDEREMAKRERAEFERLDRVIAKLAPSVVLVAPLPVILNPLTNTREPSTEVVS